MYLIIIFYLIIVLFDFLSQQNDMYFFYLNTHLELLNLIELIIRKIALIFPQIILNNIHI